jgi:hypothetical protein
MERPLERGNSSGPPYRTPGERNVPPEPSPADDLGPERSVHRARIGSALVLPGFMVTMILVVGVAMLPALGWMAMGVVFPFAAIAGTFFAIGSLRNRSVQVILHQRGLVVSSRRSRDVVLFQAVRDVWWDGLWISAYASAVTTLRLVDDRNRSHFVPLRIERADEVARWVERHCSLPLIAEARAALQGGETLTFGDVTFDREHVRFANVRLPWARIRLVRLLPGRVAFFRTLPNFPWKTVRLDRVPHPSVFVRLLRDAAPKVEIYPPQPDVDR